MKRTKVEISLTLEEAKDFCALLEKSVLVEAKVSQTASKTIGAIMNVFGFDISCFGCWDEFVADKRSCPRDHIVGCPQDRS